MKNEEAYERLNKFAGTWHTSGRLLETKEQPELNISGTDTYEWLPGGYFLLHQANVLMGEEQSHTHEIIGFDNEAGHYTMQHYDNEGNSGSMTAKVTGGVWTFTGDDLRFKGGFNADEGVFSGTWERLSEHKNWEQFMDIRLSKI